MTRKTRITAQAIWRARADWYVWHVAHHDYIKAMPPETRRLYHALASQEPDPTMTIFGGFPADWPSATAYAAASRYNLNPEYACTWYTTPAGWDIFQALWKALPEPADFLRAPSHLVTGRP